MEEDFGGSVKMECPINDFWVRLLEDSKGQPSSSVAMVEGWSFPTQEQQPFKEAPLTTDAELDGVQPDTAEVVLISAPGAVGKSTLAKQIACKTSSLYVDLATAKPVAANSLAGGLKTSGLDAAWDAQELAMLIDGLDEAMLKQDQRSFEAFLEDVRDQSSRRNMPTVIFGRTAAVEHAWMLFLDWKVKVAALRIGYFSLDDSYDLAERMMKSQLKLAKGKKYTPAHLNVAKKLLKRIERRTKNDGSRFSGYAPVIHAVATRVSEETNPGRMIKRVHTVDLKDILHDILKREPEKIVDNLKPIFCDPGLLEHLYKPGEQIRRLVADIYALQLPQPELDLLNARDAETYSKALQAWVPAHPFWDGRKAATAVFDAFIRAEALHSKVVSVQKDMVSEHALRRELAYGTTANPFLSEFYIDQTAQRTLQARTYRASGDQGRACWHHLFVAEG